MPPDDRADEQLIEAYRQGAARTGTPEGDVSHKADEPRPDTTSGREQSALDILFGRYLTPLLAFLFNNSFFSQDKDYLLEVRDEILLKVCQGIRKDPKDGGFSSQGQGSFHAWLWTIAKLEILNADKKRRHLYIPFSQAFPAQAESDDESASPEDNILFRATSAPAGTASSEPGDVEYAQVKLDRALKNLKTDEIELLQLSVRMKYKDIIKIPKFSKYKTVDSLSHKVYDITQKIRKNSASPTKAE